MSKRRKGSSIKRRHKEELTKRYRLEQKLVRVTRDGIPIPSDQKSLTKAMIEAGGLNPLQPYQPPEPPKNVLSFAAAKAKRVAESAGPSEQSLRHKESAHATVAFIKSEAKAYAKWSLRAKSGAINVTEGEELAHLIRHGVIKRTNEHEPTAKQIQDLDAKAAPKPLDPKFWNLSRKPLAPSGTPIEEFVTGRYKPEVKQELPPTPTRDWRSLKDLEEAGASNDDLYHYRPKGLRLISTVRWFVNTVDKEQWPLVVHKYTTVTAKGPEVLEWALEAVSKDPEKEAALYKDIMSGMIRHHRKMDLAVLDAQTEAMFLSEELRLTQEELKSERQASSLMEYELSHQQGRSPDEVRDLFKAGNPKPPSDIPASVEEMLNQFNTYRAFARLDGEPEAFARYVYGDPRLGELIKECADKRAEQRESDALGRQYCRNMTKFLTDFAEYHRERYEDWWDNALPNYEQAKERTNNPVEYDRQLYEAWHKRSQVYPDKREPMFNSSPARAHTVNSAVAKALTAKIKPMPVKYNNASLVDPDQKPHWFSCEHRKARMVSWWTERYDYLELQYLKTTTKGKLMVSAIKSWNKVADVLNTKVDPVSRKKHRQTMDRVRSDNRKRDEYREVKKEQRLKRKKEQELRAKIREAQRIAY